LHEIANSTPADFDVILQAVNDENMVSPAQPVAQQQQIQPKKLEPESPADYPVYSAGRV
jgi:hypothetical protein